MEGRKREELKTAQSQMKNINVSFIHVFMCVFVPLYMFVHVFLSFLMLKVWHSFDQVPKANREISKQTQSLLLDSETDALGIETWRAAGRRWVRQTRLIKTKNQHPELSSRCIGVGVNDNSGG